MNWKKWLFIILITTAVLGGAVEWYCLTGSPLKGFSRTTTH